MRRHRRQCYAWTALFAGTILLDEEGSFGICRYSVVIVIHVRIVISFTSHSHWDLLVVEDRSP